FRFPLRRPGLVEFSGILVCSVWCLGFATKARPAERSGLGYGHWDPLRCCSCGCCCGALVAAATRAAMTIGRHADPDHRSALGLDHALYAGESDDLNKTWIIQQKFGTRLFLGRCPLSPNAGLGTCSRALF